MFVGSRQTGNSALEIELRHKKALANRESLRISKETRLSERQASQKLRKLEVLQRSYLALLGKDPYPQCSREEALFEYNQPGFCYRRDGAPRCMGSLQESKSRKIVNYLDDSGGLSAKPAINVVSDTPQMAEVLSTPALVQILCELRNTAAILSDEGLLAHFAIALETDSTPLSENPLSEYSLEYLKQYRRNLIQEFFKTLKAEAEVKFPDPPRSPFKNAPASNRQSFTSSQPNRQSLTSSRSLLSSSGPSSSEKSSVKRREIEAAKVPVVPLRFPLKKFPPPLRQSLTSASSLLSTGSSSFKEPSGKSSTEKSSSEKSSRRRECEAMSCRSTSDRSSTHGETGIKGPPDSWTLRVSKMDIMRLRHELETETVLDKMAAFEQKFLNGNDAISEKE